jgi:hypothetical protein
VEAGQKETPVLRGGFSVHGAGLESGTLQRIGVFPLTSWLRRLFLL